MGVKLTWAGPWVVTELAPVVKSGRYAGKNSTGLVARGALRVGMHPGTPPRPDKLCGASQVSCAF
jgi:hypothetical protein